MISYISRNASTNFRYLISNIRITLAEVISTKISKKECGEKKECLDLIFEIRIIHTFVCRFRKGKLKIRAKCRMFEW